MPVEKIEVLVVGGGQAGLAMSDHLGKSDVPHLVLERNRIAERWRAERWDSLVANGPAWHDRYPGLEFPGFGPDDFVSKEKIADSFVAFAKKIGSPIRCGVEVKSVRKNAGRPGFRVETSEGVIEANYVVAATGPFQRPIIPAVVPENAEGHADSFQRLSQSRPDACGGGAGGGRGVFGCADRRRASAGGQAGLPLGWPARPSPRRYRGRDFVWWLGVLGMWDAAAPAEGKEHVTIAVTGADGGQTVDFRKLAGRGMTLVGRTERFKDGVMYFAADLARNVEQGDANYLSVLNEADAFIARSGLELAGGAGSPRSDRTRSA